MNSFSDTSDQVGLVLFSSAGRIDVPPQKPFKSALNAAIDNVQTEFTTNHAAGLYWAYRALLELNDPRKAQKLNEIVFFTDGRTNWFPGSFNVRQGSGSNECLSTPVDGVYGYSWGRAHYNNRVLSLQAPASPTPPPITPNCPNWAQGQNALLSIRPTWLPPASPIAGVIAPAGVPMAGFRNRSPDLNRTTVPNEGWAENIGANVTDNLARTIRQDPSLDIRIHTIGYQGDGALLVDVLERLANCDGCTQVDPVDAADTRQSKGRFVAADAEDELLSAFLDVAGFIGRIVE